MPPLFDILLPAAGSGTRFTATNGIADVDVGRGVDKLLLDLAGRSVLQRSVALFASRPDVASILIITTPSRFDLYRDQLVPHFPPNRVSFVAGGRERWESVLFGLRALAALPNPAPFVAVHDAARPFATQALIDEAFRTTAQQGAALPCLPEPATLKRLGPDGCVAQTIDRRGIFQAQTPQCFDQPKLRAGYELLLQQNQLADVTDDAQVFERMGLSVPITTGSPLNLKITTPEDAMLARALCSSAQFS